MMKSSFRLSRLKDTLWHNIAILSRRALQGSSAILGRAMDFCANSSMSTFLTMLGTSLVALAMRQRGLKRGNGHTSSSSMLCDPLLRPEEYIVFFYNRKANRNMGNVLAQWIPRFLGPNMKCFPLDPEGVETGMRALQQLHSKLRTKKLRASSNELSREGYSAFGSDEESSGVYGKQRYGGSSGIKVVVAGGDGSVCWVLQKLIEENLSFIPCGVIPLGTGNDLSYVLGWGSQAPDLYGFLRYDRIQQWVRQLRAAARVQTDIWRAEFGVRGEHGGCITQVKGGKAVDSDEITESCYCVNYSSLGLDAKLVYAVEMYRTNFRLLNKIVYAIAGMINSATPCSPISSKIASLKLNGTPIDPFALGTLQNIISLSVPSYAGGVPLWKIAQKLDRSAYEKLYVRFPNAPRDPLIPLPSMGETKLDGNTLNIDRAGFWEQCDSNFELVGARSLTQLGAAVGCERAIFGGVYQLARASSIYVEFLTGTESPIYVQVDGEAYILRHPKYFEMKWEQQATLLRCRG
eukprot:gb/GECG01001683.1/.p1 GENE.gb/GECG01001683.1/~~gb/GECG01001683.1/.p1  ORF type:complete len:519 (+),score=34.11 gb/GECG01001683.1/:1-1557(+)